MKRLIVSFLIGIFSCAVFSQDHPADTQEFTPASNIEISSGLNNFTGILGLLAEIKTVKNLTALGGIGLDSWGNKASVGIRYYHNYPKGTYYGLSFSAISGRTKNDTISVETQQPGVKQDLIFKHEKTRTINLSLGYNWKFGKRLRFFIELGYSVPLKTKPYKIITENVTLTESGKQSLNSLTPGGFIIGWGFSIGF